MSDNRQQSAPKREGAPAQIDFRPGGGGPRNMSARINGEKPKNTLKTLGRLFRYIGKSKYILIALVAITLLITAAELMYSQMLHTSLIFQVILQIMQLQKQASVQI